MLMALSSYRYVWMLICTENVHHTNTRRHVQEIALQIQEVAPTDSRGGPHHVYGVALCSVWHFALRVLDSRGGPHGFKRWPPPCVWCGTLLHVALSSIQDRPDASTIVGYILVNLDTRRHGPPDAGLTVLLTGQQCMGHEYKRYRSPGCMSTRYQVTVL